MARTTVITISTGSDQRIVASDVIFSHIANALEGICLSGDKTITINGDGSVDVGLERVYTPKRPKVLPSGRRKFKDRL